MKTLVSFLPIILPFILLVLMRQSAKKGMTISFVILLFSAYFIWQMDSVAILASIVQAIHKSLVIIIILFGAIFLMNIMNETKAVKRINQGFNNLTKDARIQAVLIAFLFGAIIEGVAGFGTPAVVVAPLLVALGFDPIAAATLALISNSVPVPFAAVGTPIQIGLGNISTDPNFLNTVAYYITSIDIFVGSFIPTVVVYIYLLFFTKNKTIKTFIEITPWTLFIGIIYQLIASVTLKLVGYEFVTISASIITLTIALITIKTKFLIPTNILKNTTNIKTEKIDMPLWKAWIPYAIVIILLLITRVIKPIKDFTLTYLDLSLNNIFGFETISSQLKLLYSPGFILVISALIALYIQKGNQNNLQNATKKSAKSVINAALALLPTLAMVQIFSNSGFNNLSLNSMPVYLAEFIGNYLNEFWLNVAPFIGELGSFITGSATVSTLTFSPIQNQIAIEYNYMPELVLALQLIGGAAGNMICVHNVVSVSSVVGTTKKEGLIIRKTVIPALLYAFFTGIIATILY